MTTMTQTLIGAPLVNADDWNSINWKKVETFIRRLQMRIAKAVREKRWGKVSALQRLLTHSHYAKLLAVKRVAQNKGRKTPGVDGVILSSAKQKFQVAKTLNQRTYQPKPLRRIYIPKKTKGKVRPLSIPTIQCRCFQALYLLGIEPVSETTADKNSYGFRPKRSTMDAIEQCFRIFSKRHSAHWVLEADIKSCFDKISHKWLINNIPMEKKTLEKWLGSGIMENNVISDILEGTPQGGIASPTLANFALDGLEAAIKQVAVQKDKVNFVRYADDFVVSGSSRKVLEDKIKPVIKTFLAERGLALSEDKTRVTFIRDGFDFLGFNIRKYEDKLLIKPSKASVKEFLGDIRYTVKANLSTKTENLIRLLNPKILGWSNYYRHSVAKEVFGFVDYQIFKVIWYWSKRRHPMKSKTWVRRKYFRSEKLRSWMFYETMRRKDGSKFHLDLVYAATIPIKRYIKLKAEATPYDPKYQNYFDQRANNRVSLNTRLIDA